MLDDPAASDIRLERDGGVAVLTIDRPQSRNAIGLGTMAPLRALIDTVAHSDARVLAIRGAGEKVFVSGGDLKELAVLRTGEEAREMARSMRGVLDALAGLPVPVVGVLNGDAYGGGCEVAMACDFRVAADDIRLAFNQVALGIMPAWGGIERLTAIVGRSRAMYLLSTGRVLTAREASALGIVEELLPRAGFEEGWRGLVWGLAAASPLSLRAIKAVVGAVAPPVRPDLEATSTGAFAATWVSEEHWEAVEMLAERRRLARRE